MKKHEAIRILDVLAHVPERQEVALFNAAVSLMNAARLTVRDIPPAVAEWIGVDAPRSITRRHSGEGCVCLRGDGRWIGSVSLGPAKNGTRKRKTVCGNSREEIEEKLAKLKRSIAEGELRRIRIESRHKKRAAYSSDLPICRYSASGQLPEIPVAGKCGSGVRWQEQHVRVLGLYQDEVIANVMGVPKKCVASKRSALGIPHPRVLLKCTRCSKMFPSLKRQGKPECNNFCGPKCTNLFFLQKNKTLIGIGKLAQDQMSFSEALSAR